MKQDDDELEPKRRRRGSRKRRRLWRRAEHARRSSAARLGDRPRKDKTQNTQAVQEQEEAAPASLTYVPVFLFIQYTVFTLGFYPILWLRKCARALDRMSGGAFDARAAMRCCIAKAVSRAALVLCALCIASSIAFGSLALLHAAEFFLISFIAVTVAISAPLSCKCFFDIRWHIRRAAAEWDGSGLMLRNTMPSPVLLFIFGSAYVQYHVDRLIELDMPGFDGYDDVVVDAPAASVLKSFVRRSSE